VICPGSIHELGRPQIAWEKDMDRVMSACITFMHHFVVSSFMYCIVIINSVIVRMCHFVLELARVIPSLHAKFDR